MSKYGILIVSHSKDIAQGIADLINQIAVDVDISIAGGTEGGEIGTSFEVINEALATNNGETILAFFDLGSAKMNLELVQDFSEKEIRVYETPIVEGAYTAAALLQADVDIETIESQLDELKIIK